MAKGAVMAVEGRKRRALSVLVLSGGVIGGLLISPVGAHVGDTLPHLRQHLDNFFLSDVEGDAAYLGKTQKAADSNLLDGLDSSQFVQGTGGKADDADLLDALDSTAFLRTTGKAADADKLDNLDSSAFLTTAGKAADANLLDGSDSTAFQARIHWAYIEADGTISAQSGGITVQDSTGTSGDYYLHFPTTVAGKGVSATMTFETGVNEILANACGAGTLGIACALGTNTTSDLYVKTLQSDGTGADSAFYIAVFS